MKKYLVTGGAGFIGSNFVKYLLKTYDNDVEIIIVDALTYAGNLMTIADDIKRDNVTFVHADIRDVDTINTLVANEMPDYIVNFAAESHVDRSITGPRIFVETNVLGTQTLLDAARHAWQKPDGTWLDGHKYLQISTDEVYGQLPLDGGFFTEDTPLAPSSPYSASKASADMLTLAYGHTFGMPVNITRCSNNYGPYHFPEKLIPLLINNILEGRELPVYGKGLNVRDWLYVEDHCSAIDTVLRKGVAGEVYNVGGHNEHANIEIVNIVIDTVAEMTGSEPRHDLITFVRDRAGHDLRYAIDPTKIGRELGWQPATKFKDGIRHTIRWFLDNKDWMQAVTSGEYRDYYTKMYSQK